MMTLSPRMKHAALVGLMLCAVGLAYANHFRNGFHFDDSHAIVDNAYLRSLKNVSLFFTDAQCFSAFCPPTARTGPWFRFLLRSTTGWAMVWSRCISSSPHSAGIF